MALFPTFLRALGVTIAAFALSGCPVQGSAGDATPSDTLDATSSETLDGTDVPTAPDGLDAPTDSSGDGAPSLITGRHEVLFVGNSYIFVNDVAGHYRAIAVAMSPDARVVEATIGSSRLTQHASEALRDGSPIARWLRTGTPDETSFDVVILQEQSQVGGFPAGSPEREASLTAAADLARLARARGAAVVLYMTWGREYGDPDNASIGFGTFRGMQDRLDEGYLGMAARLRAQGFAAYVAPVGGGFRIVFEDVTRGGGDPLAEGSEFDALYEGDGSHPSLRGAYLASCIIAGTITAADVRRFADEPVLGPAVSGRLRDVCARTLVDPRFRVPDAPPPEGEDRDG